MPVEPGKEQMIAFKEVVRPPIWLLAFIFFLLSSVALSLWAVFDNPTGLISLAVSVLLLIFIARSMRLTIHVDEKELRVGKARIDRIYIGEVKELSVAEMARTRGRDADPAAYLALRFWEPRGIRVDLKDPRDPVPYWLITSKNADGLAKALAKN